MEKIIFEDATIITPSQVNVDNEFNVGSIIQFAGTTIPSGWLLCDGSAISRTTYADLFNTIGITYGNGDGSTTFNLPNLKGRVVVGQDTSQTEFDTLGETGGEKTHTLTVDEMPSHNHGMNAFSDGGNTGRYNATITWNTTSLSEGNRWIGDTVATGGGQAHNILQPYITLNYIIKVTSETRSLNVIDAITSGGTNLNANTFNTMQDNIENAIIDSYSTSEVKTNKVWIDGKPLYTKTINFGSLPNNTYKSVEHGIQNYDVIFVDFSASYATNGSGQFQGVNSIGLGTNTYVNEDDIICSTNNNRDNWSAIITIKYTKTTD